MGPEAGGQDPLFRKLPSVLGCYLTQENRVWLRFGGGGRGAEPAVKIYVAAVEALMKKGKTG
jgi:hypothetical protein